MKRVVDSAGSKRSFPTVVRSILKKSPLQLVMRPKRNTDRLLTAADIRPVSEEHAQVLKQVMIDGTKVLGNDEELRQWLQLPFWGREVKPIVMLETLEGAQLVHNHIMGIAFGHPV